MSELIVQKEAKSIVSEAYKTLGTNIQFSSLDKNMEVVLVTSSGPKEGKSTVSGNLALTMADTGKKVLLVDCDLRKPSLHKKFGISNEIGLSNILAGECEAMSAASQYMDNLFILTSGTIPPNPSEMLVSKKMKVFIEEMRKSYDFIILDTPSVIETYDARILSTIADGVVLVVSSGKSERDLVKKAKDLLDNVKANIIGVVLNKVDIGSKR